jgi:hypothetical protein
MVPGMSRAMYQAMLESAGLATVDKTGRGLLPQSLPTVVPVQMSLQEAAEKLAAIRNVAAMAVGDPPPQTAPSIVDTLASAQHNSEQMIGTVQNLAAMVHMAPGAANPAILSLPAPTQSAPAAVTTAQAIVNDALSQIIQTYQ